MKNNKSKQDEMKSKKTLSENQNKYLKRIIPNDLHSNPNLLTDHPELNVLKAIIEGKISNKDNSQAKSCKHNFLFCWICSLLNIFKPSSHKNIVYKNTFSIAYFSSWGTGKTSRLKDLLSNQMNITPIIISVWKFAKIKNADHQLHNLIITEIIGHLSGYNDSISIITEKTSRSSISINYKNTKIGNNKTKKDTITKSLSEKTWLLNERINSKLKKFNGKPIVIIFDDLDRVDYSLMIPMLDIIRNYLEIPGVISIVPIDESKLIKGLDWKPPRENPGENIETQKERFNYRRFLNKYFSYPIKATNYPNNDRETIIKAVIGDIKEKTTLNAKWVQDVQSIFTGHIKDFTFRSAKDILNRFNANLIALNVPSKSEYTKLMAFATLIQVNYPKVHSELLESRVGPLIISKLLSGEHNTLEWAPDLLNEMEEIYSNYIKSPAFPKEPIKDINTLFWRYITLSLAKGEKLNKIAEFHRIIDKIDNDEEYEANLPIVEAFEILENSEHEQESDRRKFVNKYLVNEKIEFTKESIAKIKQNFWPLFNLKFKDKNINKILNLAKKLNLDLKDLYEKYGEISIISTFSNNEFSSSYLTEEIIEKLKNKITKISVTRLDETMKLDQVSILNENLIIVLNDIDDFNVIVDSEFEIEEFILNAKIKMLLNNDEKAKIDNLYLILENQENKSDEWIQKLWDLASDWFSLTSLIKSIVEKNTDISIFEKLNNEQKIKIQEILIEDHSSRISTDFNLFNSIDWSDNIDKKLMLQQKILDKSNLILEDNFMNQDLNFSNYAFKNIKEYSELIVWYFENYNSSNNIKLISTIKTTQDKWEENMNIIFQTSNNSNSLQNLLNNIPENLKLTEEIFTKYKIGHYKIRPSLLPTKYYEEYINNLTYLDSINFDASKTNTFNELSKLRHNVEKKYVEYYNFVNNKVSDLRKKYINKNITPEFKLIMDLYNSINKIGDNIEWKKTTLFKTQFNQYKKSKRK